MSVDFVSSIALNSAVADQDAPILPTGTSPVNTGGVYWSFNFSYNPGIRNKPQGEAKKKVARGWRPKVGATLEEVRGIISKGWGLNMAQLNKSWRSDGAFECLTWVIEIGRAHV